MSDAVYKLVQGTQNKRAEVTAASSKKAAKKEKAEEVDPVMALFD